MTVRKIISSCSFCFNTIKPPVCNHPKQSRKLRDGRLENLWGGDEVRQLTPINPKKYSCYGLKKTHTRNLITKKNSCGSKIPNTPPPPENFCLWNPKCGKIFLWNQESRALESGTWLKESGIPLTIGIQDLSSTDRESGI